MPMLLDALIWQLHFRNPAARSRSLVKISSVLETSLDELLSNEVNKPAKSTKRNLQERIASAVEVLNEDDLARIAIMLDAWAAARS
jgi:hypothetical protein